MHGAGPAAARRVLVLMPTVRDAERTALLLQEWPARIWRNSAASSAPARTCCF
jgi:hypothetical protein